GGHEPPLATLGSAFPHTGGGPDNARRRSRKRQPRPFRIGRWPPASARGDSIDCENGAVTKITDPRAEPCEDEPERRRHEEEAAVTRQAGEPARESDRKPAPRMRTATAPAIATPKSVADTGCGSVTRTRDQRGVQAPKMAMAPSLSAIEPVRRPV